MGGATTLSVVLSVELKEHCCVFGVLQVGKLFDGGGVMDPTILEVDLATIDEDDPDKEAAACFGMR